VRTSGLAVALAIAVAASAVFAGPAAAGGTLTPTGARLVAGAQQIAGPSFAGDGIAWATPSHLARDYDVRVLRGGALDTQHVTVYLGGIDTTQAFAASADAVALAVTVRVCGSDCRSPAEVYSSDVFAGPVGQPLPTSLCSSREETDSVDLEGSVIAYRDGCAGATTVRDLSAPEAPWREFPAVGDVRIAGGYLAVATTAKIVVYDWRAGDTLYEVNRAPVSFDVSSDGVVTFSGANDELDWASQDEPTPHRIAGVEFPGKVRAAGTRVAVRSGRRFRVLERDGTEIASTSADEAFEFDFDGTRLVYGSHPCQVSAIVTWDLQSDPPALPPGPCPKGRLASRTGSVDLRRQTFTAAVRCPAKPALGCSGEWYPRLVPSRSSMQTKLVAMDPGARRRISFRLFRRQACAFARGRVQHVNVYLGSSGGRRDGEPGTNRPARLERFKLTGRARGCR
jgi:hypothetical protein